MHPALSRRAFVGSVGFLLLLQRLPRALVEAAFAQPQPFRFFDARQAAVVTEATARLIPGPRDDPEEAGHPGAREAGVVHYIDLLLTAFEDDPPRIYAGGPWSDRHGGAENLLARFVPLAPWEERAWRRRIAALRRRYRAGIAALDRAADGDFAAAPPERQDAILASRRHAGFRRLLFEHAIEGMYAIPEYGGNRELAGWREIGYAGDVAPRGWPDEAMTAAVEDVAPPGVELPFPAQVSDERKPVRRLQSAGGEIADLQAFLDAALPLLARGPRA
ncbi:MAG TPA: gluconate 2-dehydrogenase subunit 3 family protein [Gaiellaceae bacterium]|nr:gluconate 2-dehydrogenase subunit 3 family protein [Gaiellaceae bacterium]